MKVIWNVMLIMFISIAFAACQKANDPVSPTMVNKTDQGSSTGVDNQGYSGSFQVIYKNYKNTSATTSLTGSINFIFEANKYSYTARVSSTVEDPADVYLHDTGTYTRNGDFIQLSDDATKMMHAQWMPSLYLSGDYSYSQIGDQIIIEGTGRFGSVKITLKTPSK